MLRLSCLMVLCTLLSGCFVPNKYYAVLTLTDKQYILDFIGEMHIMALHSPEGTDPSVDRKAAQQQILSEFSRVIKEREPTRFELRDVDDALFQTKFTYASPYSYPEASGLFTFHIDGHRLTVTSRKIGPEEKKLIQEKAIPSEGTLCIKTYGKIIESNAHQKANLLQQCSTWHMKNLDDGVKMVIEFPNSLEENRVHMK